MSKYDFTPDMGEISGFGGGYEKTCRAMLRAALEWLDEHPDADPQFHGYEGVYGVVMEDNEDAKALTKAALDAAGGDCTGAMHQAVISSALWIRTHGWDEYAKQMAAVMEKLESLHVIEIKIGSHIARCAKRGGAK